MEKNNLQTTVKQLEEFLSAYYRKTGVRPTLGEALDMMEKDNLLSAPRAVAAADSKVQHTVEEICEIIDSQPVNATAFLQNTSPSESGTSHVSGEDAVFAPGRDVTVTRVFSYLSADAAEYDYFTIAVVLKGECEFFFAGTPIARQTLSTYSQNMGYSSASSSNYLKILNNLVGILVKYGLIGT